MTGNAPVFLRDRCGFPVLLSDEGLLSHAVRAEQLGLSAEQLPVDTTEPRSSTSDRPPVGSLADASAVSPASSPMRRMERPRRRTSRRRRGSGAPDHVTLVDAAHQLGVDPAELLQQLATDCATVTVSTDTLQRLTTAQAARGS